MAKTRNGRGKIEPIRNEDAQEPATPAPAPAEEPAPAAQAAPDQPETPEAPAKRPPKVLPFMRQVASIAKEDWGTRYQIKVYRLAPIIDRLRGSETKYVCIYHEPIDEEKLKLDHGSGRYRLYLNCKAPAAKGEKEIDMVELDVLDMNFPPKVPPSEWVDDPRNKQWAWAAPKGSAYYRGDAGQPQGGSSDPMQMLETFEKMQERIEKRMPKVEIPDPIAQATAAINIMDKAATLLKPAEKKDDGMSEFMGKRFDAMEKELAESRRRNDTLMEKLIDAKTAPTGNGLGAIKEIFGAVKEFLPTIREFLPQTPAESVVRREKEPWWMGLAQTIVEGIQPAMPIIAHGLVNFANRQPAPQVQNGKVIPAQPANTAPAAVPEPDIWEMLLNALSDEATGDDFAQSVITLFGKMKYMQACMLGEQGLLNFLQAHPIWERLGPFQGKMGKFIHEFVAYGKDEDDEEGETAPGEEEPEQPEVSHAAEAPIEL